MIYKVRCIDGMQKRVGSKVRRSRLIDSACQLTPANQDVHNPAHAVWKMIHSWKNYLKITSTATQTIFAGVATLCEFMFIVTTHSLANG